MSRSERSTTDDDTRLEALIALLVCPGCRGELARAPAALDCRACGLRYPILAGVPRMAPEEAQRLR